MAELTAREVQVLELIAEGLTNADIGAKLYLSEFTIKTHAGRLYRRLGVTDRAHAVSVGYQTGVLTCAELQAKYAALQTELGRVYRALVVATSLVEDQGATVASVSHPFGDYLLGLVA